MHLLPIAPFLLVFMLLGSSACAPSIRDPGNLNVRRIAELDRLERQAGMPDTYPSRGLQEARSRALLPTGLRGRRMRIHDARRDPGW